MKIALFGASGTIGKAIQNELGQRHEMVAIARQHGEYQADIRDPASLEQLFARLGKVDAIVSAAGGTPFVTMDVMRPQDMLTALHDKAMGQINLVLIGQQWLNDGGSFTLVSGILSHDPILQGACASTANGAIEAFVRAAAIELPRGLRINAVSPTVVTESMTAYASFFRGFEPVPASRVALAYSKSIEGRQTGQVYPAR